MSNFTDIAKSVSAQSSDTLAMEGRRAEIGFVEARALEPQVHIVVPREADPAIGLLPNFPPFISRVGSDFPPPGAVVLAVL
jgi:hypothetical protein